MYRILVTDDDKDIRSAVNIYLTREGYEVIEAENGLKAFEVLRSENIHLVLMDIMMPGMDGMTATEKIREEFNVPVILLTAKSEDNDKILGLTIGADDYITKPFNPFELIARVKAQLRRYTYLGGMEHKKSHLSMGGIEMYDDGKAVTLDGEGISLTPTEYEILKLLLSNPGHVYSSRDIYRLVWNNMPIGNENSVAVHIRHLREKIEIDPANPRYIKVVWGQGYKMEVIK